MASDIIHAEGVRFAVPSSAPQARNLLSSGHVLAEPISEPECVAGGFACDLPRGKRPGGQRLRGGQYPNLVGNPYAGQNSAQWLNQAAFQRPPDGQFGNLGRNALRRPRITNVDTALLKNFNFTETIKLTFRAEVFNLFNHPEPWSVNTTFNGDNPGSGISSTAATFGQINGWRDARTLQLALRFSF